MPTITELNRQHLLKQADLGDIEARRQLDSYVYLPDIRASAGPALSVVIPLFNEEQNVPMLHAAITEALAPLNIAFEIVFVDDGSTDGTFSAAEGICRQDGRVVVVKLQRNSGQTAATVAGMDAACGRIIVTMDGDLQNDPADIPRLLDVMAQGYDLVAGWRERRQDDLWRRKVPSYIANRLITWITGIRIRDNGCSLKAFRSELIKKIPLYSDMHRFLPAMSALAGARIAQIPVRHHPRRYGQSKYGLSRIFKVLVDLIWIKTVLTIHQRRFIPLLGTAGAAGLAGLALIGWSMAASQSPESALVLGTVGLLLNTLSFYLVMAGQLGQLLYRDGAIQFEELSALTAQFAHRTPTASDSP